MEIIGLARGGRGQRIPHISCSVGRPQNGPHLRMLEHVFPQPVVMTGAHPGEPRRPKRQMAIRIQTRRDPQSVRRKVTLEHVVAGDVKDIVT